MSTIDTEFHLFSAGVHRCSYSEAQEEGAAPQIPVQPLSYGDAVHFLSQLTDHTPPQEWAGGLDIQYRITQSENNTKYVCMSVCLSLCKYVCREENNSRPSAKIRPKSWNGRLSTQLTGHQADQSCILHCVFFVCVCVKKSQLCNSNSGWG